MQHGAYIMVPESQLSQAEPWGLDIAGELEWDEQQDAGKKARAVTEPQPSPED